MPQLVFLTLFLALAAGPHTVELRSTPDVVAVRLELDGFEVATMKQPPWRTSIDLGPDFEPHNLVAIGFDKAGDEIARTSQMINITRPVAEVAIVVEQKNEKPFAITLVGHHAQLVAPGSAVVRVDGRKIAVDGYRAVLPRLDPSKPHVIDARLQFLDRTMARSELVLEGGFSDSVGTEMTPIAVNNKAVQDPPSAEECFSSRGVKLRASTLETPESLIVLVQNPDVTNVKTVLEPKSVAPARRKEILQLARDLRMRSGTFGRIVWPTARTVSSTEGLSATKLFHNSAEEELVGRSLIELMVSPGKETEDRTCFVADAVTVAGLLAIELPRRRAVVLILDDAFDASEHSAASARHYLQSIGVPLFVWSPCAPSTDLLDEWEDVDDISTPDGMRNAARRLLEALDRQSIVWLAADPVTALQAKVDPRCGLEPIARSTD